MHSLAESKRIDAFCHAQSPSIAFIRAETRGVFASVFTDFGPKFTVIYVNGEKPHAGIVASIESGPDAMVTCVEDERLQFKVKKCMAHSFLLDIDTSVYGEYLRGGIVTQVKDTKILAFNTLSKAMKQPGEFLVTDFAKFDRPPLLHVGFLALDAFEAETGHAPRPANAEDAKRMLALATAINEKMPSEAKAEINNEILTKLAHNANAEISPMTAMFGGIVGQEVVKAVSGKFHPVHQWMYFDSIESLPSETLPPKEYEPVGSSAKWPRATSSSSALVP
eukprot:gene22623-29766_t